MSTLPVTEHGSGSPWSSDKLGATVEAIRESGHLSRDAADKAGLSALTGRTTGAERLDELAGLAEAAEQATAGVAQWALPRPARVARRVTASLQRLQRATTAEELLRAAPGELGTAGDFDRVLLSRVSESWWSPESWWARDAERPQDRAIVGSLRGTRTQITNGMVEAEVVRRRSSALVRDTCAEPRTWKPFADIAESSSYVVAPFVAGDKVIGLLHADTGVTGRPLGQGDVQAVRVFAEGLGLLLERLAVVDRIGVQGKAIREALAEADRAVEELGTTSLRLPRPRPAGADEPTAERVLPAGRRLEDRLTAREREVFALLVGGATNAQIADRLTVSETTVKSHVKHILRKLHAGNRAQAIAQYLRSADGGERR